MCSKTVTSYSGAKNFQRVDIHRAVSSFMFERTMRQFNKKIPERDGAGASSPVQNESADLSGALEACLLFSFLSTLILVFLVYSNS